VHDRHRQVHQDQLGPQLDGQADGLLAVARFADDVEAGVLHRPPQALAQELVIVDEEETGIHAARSLQAGRSEPPSGFTVTSTWIHVPLPGWESTSRRAPMALA